MSHREYVGLRFPYSQLTSSKSNVWGIGLQFGDLGFWVLESEIVRNLNRWVLGMRWWWWW